MELWHVSEDESIARFEPPENPEHDSPEALVSARACDRSAHVPALLPLWERVIASTLEFSGIRLRNLNRT